MSTQAQPQHSIGTNVAGDSDDHQIMAILAHMSQQQSAVKGNSRSRVPSPEASPIRRSLSAYSPPPPPHSRSLPQQLSPAVDPILRLGPPVPHHAPLHILPHPPRLPSVMAEPTGKPGKGGTGTRSGSEEDDGDVKKSGKEDDWTRTRKDNHKEVERRRRETINDGINDLKKIVPGCEKNKGSILQRAVQYIQQLKEAEASNIEKWTLEKLLTDQSISETRHELDSYKAHVDVIEVENEQLRDENDRLRTEVIRLGGLRAEEHEHENGRGEKRGLDEDNGPVGGAGPEEKRMRVAA